ncbi:hypothetical protein E1A91_A10G198300v1 [Gossypium mustelinum]|uniref:Uncharacterized protein n=1 Tax=Gossypium mustelinum TaxID=34275 RepID=A0A5D2XNQ0_GOSMU|nr:hypothetical protein E1A91_A10G198300v1 [Gossypium mustelinum]
MISRNPSSSINVTACKHTLISATAGSATFSYG